MYELKCCTLELEICSVKFGELIDSKRGLAVSACCYRAVLKLKTNFLQMLNEPQFTKNLLHQIF